MSILPSARMSAQTLSSTAFQPALGRTSQSAGATAPAHRHDHIQFGGPEKTTPAPATEKKEKSETPAKPSVTTAAKNAFKAAFRPWGLAQDFGIGLLLAVATVLIPPHAHALAMIPFSFIFGMGLRSGIAIKDTYWPTKP